MSASGGLTIDDAAGGDSFPRVARLGEPLGERAATELASVCARLRKSGAHAAADRLRGIDDFVGRLDFPALEKLADPDRAADELTGSPQRPARRAHMWRNIIALFPLVITWLALGFASSEYSRYLAAHPASTTQPFLLLWQQGFGGRYPTFLDVALVDFALLMVVIALTWRVHRQESKTAQWREQQEQVVNDLYTALNTLGMATAQPTVRLPASAEEWADAARRIITGAMEQTRLLAETSQQAIDAAGTRLSSLQDQGREYLDEYSAEIQQTLKSVREDNEQFIRQTASESRETLRRLVEQQMEPLLNQLNTMLAEFGRHQETYRTGISDFSQSVWGIQAASRELADSAHSYRESAGTMNDNLAKIASSQEGFGMRISGSVESMQTSAAAMSEAKDVLHGMGEGVRQMSVDIVTASHAMDAVQRNLASTTAALSDSAMALGRVARDLRETAASADTGGGWPPWRRGRRH